MKIINTLDGRIRAVMTKTSLRPLAALALALPLIPACTGTTTYKLPDGTSITHDWDTGQLHEIWVALEELIELNLEFLDPDTLLNNRAAYQLALDNIEEASALKEKVEERLGLPQSSVG